MGDKVPVNYVKGKKNMLRTKQSWLQCGCDICVFRFWFAEILSDEAIPTIKEDTEYPEWLSTVGAKVTILWNFEAFCLFQVEKLSFGIFVCFFKEPSLGELVERAETLGINEETFTVQEAKRLKRLLTLEEIKNANSSKNSDSG